jgi:hypothetical protein
MIFIFDLRYVSNVLSLPSSEKEPPRAHVCALESAAHPSVSEVIFIKLVEIELEFKPG